VRVPKVSDEHRADRRRQIAEGARRAFAEHGYHGATVEVLEQEIGLSRGAIFSYFPTKLDLFVALAEEDRHELIRLWLELGHEGIVRHIVEEEPSWTAVYLDAARLMRSDPELRERWLAMNPELEGELQRHYEELRSSGQIRDDLPLEAVGRFLGIVFDGIAVQQGARFGPPVDVDATIELLRSALAPK
jgi:AcrR family transcriptional regulator